MPARRSLVTGAAGFVGSHLAERLVADGHTVVGVDSLTDYYAVAQKRRNLATLQREPRFSLVSDDLLEADLERLLEGVDYVFHQAGQPGVRASWGKSFEAYVKHNVLATQALLEAVRAAGRLQRFIYASSSSVYGDAEQLPVREDALPRPVSPYGVTKLAAEHLCVLYAKLGVPTVSLRYFTVYGPRQRPDMAFHKFIRAMLEGREIDVNGDGRQTRDFTFVTDIVEANLAAASRPVAGLTGRVYNLGGGTRISVNDVLSLLRDVVGAPARVRHRPEPPGEARHTYADTSAARAALGFVPRVALRDGLAAETAWLRAELGLG
ncbi:MAG: NAD-dependent epimerase/dehydratase family protein [Candidatus Dormibacteraeota bacterium]|nr:NAD-dependent epimerase/dehydratase family protein [Candidatus Dormibacteraeota bacterium]